MPEEEADFACGLILMRFNPQKQPEFLLIQHLAGHWGFPKGHPETGETWLAAACREVKEETGLQVEQDYCLPLATHLFEERYTIKKKKKNIIKTVRYTLGLMTSDCRVSIQTEELQDFCWLSADDAKRQITFEQSRQLLTQALQVIGENIEIP